MLFYTSIKMGEEFATFVLLAREEVNNSRIYYNFNDILASNELIGKLRYSSSAVYVTSREDFKYPILTCHTKDFQNNVNFTSVFNLFKDRLDTDIQENLYPAVASKLNAQSRNIYNLDGNDIKQFVLAMKDFISYFNDGPRYKINISETYIINIDRTKELIEENNKSQFSLSFMEQSKNVTKFMETPDSPVFIALPTYDTICIQDYRQIPKYGDVIKPFKDGYSVLRTTAYKENIPENFDAQLVTGNPDNNDLGIQENEEEFYSAMKELIDFGIKQEYPDKELEDCVSQGIGSKYVKDYLTELAVRCARWNWSHTGSFPVEYIEETDDDADRDLEDQDSNDSNSEGIGGNKSYHCTDIAPTPLSIVDGEMILTDYINNATLKNVYAPAEAVIKLLRWGYRKPSRLKLEGTNKYLDLNMFRVESLSGSFKGLEPKLINGAKYNPIALIMAKGKFTDMKYSQQLGYSNGSLNIPVGLMCQVSYDNGQKQAVMFSMMDLIKDLDSNPNDIVGIKLNSDGSVSTSLSFTDEDVIALDTCNGVVRLSRSGERIYYSNPALVNFYFEFTQLDSSTSELNLLGRFINDPDIGSKIEYKSFSTKQELLNKYAVQNNLSDLSKLSTEEINSLLRNVSAIKDYLDMTVAKKILPVVLYVAKENIEYRKNGELPTFENYLNLYKAAMERTGYSNSYISESTQSSKVEGDLEKMMIFDNDDKNEDNDNDSIENNDERERKRVISEIIRPIENPENVYKLISKGANNNAELLGYVAFETVNGKRKYILSVNPPKFEISKSSVNFLQIVKIAVIDFYYLLNGDADKSRLRFTDMESWKAIGSQISKHI